MADIHPRLRAVWDLSVAEVREYCGRHEYDGTIQDLSPDGVRAGLRELAAARPGEPAEPAEALADDHDEAHLVVFERAAQVSLGELELHRGKSATVPARRTWRPGRRPPMPRSVRSTQSPPRSGRRWPAPPAASPRASVPMRNRRPLPPREPPMPGWSATWSRPPRAAAPTGHSAAAHWPR